jgi:hypothetical protein
VKFETIIELPAQEAIVHQDLTDTRAGVPHKQPTHCCRIHVDMLSSRALKLASPAAGEGELAAFVERFL